MLALSFKAQTGADIVVVPYKGASTLITDMIGGQIDGGFETTSVILGHIREHSVKAIAVIRPTRLPDLPGTRTMIESGVPDLKGSSWTGVLAPLGTPQPIIDRLRTESVAALKSPEMIERFRNLGAEAKFLTPQEFGTFIAEEHQRLGAIIRASGVRGE
jgi:tripartite-type tricarboxylate transporter receptor subunit TctC